MTSTHDTVTSLHFFLGGADLEMQAIAQLLAEHAPDRWTTSGQRWGVRASAMRTPLQAALDRGRTPVTVELPWDLPWRPPTLIEIDHHGARAGADQPSSLHQVFDLLALPAHAWTRQHALIAANDSGYIEAMQQMGASVEEIAAIRAADRAAQGITAAEESLAMAALAQVRQLAHGRLSIAELPHNRTAALVDRLHPALGGPGYQSLLVLSPDETNFYGSGAQILALDQAFPGGWYGGALPQRGYWGIGRRVDQAALETALRECC